MKNRRTILVDCLSQVIRDNSGEPTLLIIFMRDVTEQSEYHEKLTKRAAHLEFRNTALADAYEGVEQANRDIAGVGHPPSVRSFPFGVTGGQVSRT